MNKAEHWHKAIRAELNRNERTDIGSIQKAISGKPSANTDKELWREPTDKIGSEYYANSVHVTEGGEIGINVGGAVIVKPLAEWHEAAIRYDEIVEALSKAHAAGVREGIEKLEALYAKQREICAKDEKDPWSDCTKEILEVNREIRALIKE